MGFFASVGDLLAVIGLILVRLPLQALYNGFLRHVPLVGGAVRDWLNGLQQAETERSKPLAGLWHSLVGLGSDLLDGVHGVFHAIGDAFTALRNVVIPQVTSAILSIVYRFVNVINAAWQAAVHVVSFAVEEAKHLASSLYHDVTDRIIPFVVGWAYGLHRYVTDVLIPGAVRTVMGFVADLKGFVLGVWHEVQGLGSKIEWIFNNIVRAWLRIDAEVFRFMFDPVGYLTQFLLGIVSGMRRQFVAAILHSLVAESDLVEQVITDLISNL